MGMSFLSKNRKPAYPSTIGSPFGVRRLAMIRRKQEATSAVMGI